MNTPYACLPMPIALGRSPLQRVWHELSERMHALLERLRNAARERAERRLARSHRALYESLDARTLRDIGLGDWAGRAHDDGAATWQRTSSLRGF
jgi:hypothetical protein